MASNIYVRQVYEHNVENEFNLIRASLLNFPYVSMDTEYPGTVSNHEGIPAHLISPASFYKVMKQNVDVLKLIQVGLTLSNFYGELPSFGTGWQFVWEFNFRDFDYETDENQNRSSTSLLERQGIDFKKNRKDGIDSRDFAQLFEQHVLGPFHSNCWVRLTWVTFHGPYDFGFLIKILTQRKLPEDVDDFLALVSKIFGTNVFDVKIVMRLLGWHGGLDRVARSLELKRVAGKAHQAGSDSLLTTHVFHKLTWKWWNNKSMMRSNVDLKSLMVYGLTKLPL